MPLLVDVAVPVLLMLETQDLPDYLTILGLLCLPDILVMYLPAMCTNKGN